MSDSEDDATKFTPHQASIRQKELEKSMAEIQNRIGALRQQVAKYDAIDYRRAQLAHEHKLVKQMREELKAEEAAYLERREEYLAENIELASVIKERQKESLLKSRKELENAKILTSQKQRDESTRYSEFLETFNEEDLVWRKELRGLIVEAQKTQLANRQEFIESRKSSVRKEKEGIVSKKTKQYDEGTKDMANLILKEARVIRQLLKLREAHATPRQQPEQEATNNGKSL